MNYDEFGIAEAFLHPPVARSSIRPAGNQYRQKPKLIAAWEAAWEATKQKDRIMIVNRLQSRRPNFRLIALCLVALFLFLVEPSMSLGFAGMTNQARPSKFALVQSYERKCLRAAHEAATSRTVPDYQLRAIFLEGNHIDRLARESIYSDGVTMSGVGNDLAIEETNRSILDPAITMINQPTFRSSQLTVRLDSIQRSGSGWDHDEVKSSLSIKPKHIFDALTSTRVAEEAGLNVSNVNLTHINRGFRMDDPIEGLFVINDITEMIEDEDMNAHYTEVLDSFSSGIKPPANLTKGCWKCPFFGSCFGETEHPVTELTRLTDKRIADLRRLGVFDIRDIPDSFDLTPKQREYVERVKSGLVHVNHDSLAVSLDRIRSPVRHLDFESVSFASPMHPEVAPWQHVATQYSVHLEGADGLVHSEHLSESQGDGRRELAERLIEDLGTDDGSVIVWNASYERGRIRDMSNWFPDLSVPLNNILDRIFDLQPLVRKNVLHPGFHGSTSLKSVAPVLAPGFSYQDLEGISGGGDAQGAMNMILRSAIDEEMVPILREQLLRYCEHDTLATVEILQALRELIGTGCSSGNRTIGEDSGDEGLGAIAALPLGIALDTNLLLAILLVGTLAATLAIARILTRTKPPRFEDFGLPDDLHTGRAPHRYWMSRENRRNYLLWLASYLGLPNPSEDQDPWYGLGFDGFHTPMRGFRSFGKGVYDSWNRSNSRLRGTYQLAIMDAFPEVEWRIWEFKGRSHLSRWAGFNLPHPDVEEITEDSPVIHISRRTICRGFLLQLAERLSDSHSWIDIQNDPSEWNESSWRGVTSEVVHNLSPPMPSIGTFWRNGGCPVASSLFSALSTYFDDVDFVWRRWLVGGRVANGFGIPSEGNEENAREEVQDLLGWVVHKDSGIVLEGDNLDLLYDVGQRSISRWYGALLGTYWNGSPQALIEFAYPEGPEGEGWDPTLFGLNRERQRLFWHHLRRQLSPDEFALMDEQENQGWERDMTELGLYPRTEMPDGHSFGGPNSHYPDADIWLETRNLMVDVLGEDHFDECLSRSNSRSMDDVRRRFRQRQVQDLQRWRASFEAGYHVIAIGPDLAIDDEGMEAFRSALELTLDEEGPTFQAIGWPEGAIPPEFPIEEGE